jgi:hypothetical protein
MSKFFAAVIGAIGLFFLVIVINAFIIKLAWAYSLTTLFYFPEPTWTEAFALSMLCGALFSPQNNKVKMSEK